MADIDAIERLLCERYNVSGLDAGELSNSLAVARSGNLQPLIDALAARELYRWQGPILEALAVESEPEVEQEAEPEGFASMTIAELRAYAEENAIDLGDARLKADIVAAIELTQEEPAER